jgi:hypothetical protein
MKYVTLGFYNNQAWVSYIFKKIWTCSYFLKNNRLIINVCVCDQFVTEYLWKIIKTSNLRCVCEQCVTKYQIVEFKRDRYFVNKVEIQ